MPDFRLSNSAVLDLIDIAFYGDARYGAAASDRFRAQLEARFSYLAAQPLLFPAVDHIRAGYRRSVFKGLSIYYRIEGQDIVIARVIGRQETIISDEDFE